MQSKVKKEKKPKKVKGPLLPKGYLSWSQLDLWERDPEEYKARYFYGKPSPESGAMSFGKHISRVLEGKEKPGNHIEQSIKLLCKRCGSPEYEIKTVLKTAYGDVVLLGYLDDIDSKTFGEFVENKTGTTKWSSKKAENHGQLHFYYLLIILATGTRPQRSTLQHFETQLDAGAPFGRKLTGQIHTYEVSLFIGHEIEIRRRIENAVREISQAYEAVLKIKA